jgi:GTPase SAR1 family protein
MSGSYTDRLKVLQKVHQHAGGSLDLPRIAVVGDQSSGKSTLLSQLTDVQFPTSSGICTKAPINVVCTCNPNLPETTFQIQDGSNGFVSVSGNELPGQILEAQKKLIAEEGGEQKVSMQEIFVKAEGPTLMDIIITDLPGIINDGNGKEETRALITR